MQEVGAAFELQQTFAALPARTAAVRLAWRPLAAWAKTISIEWAIDGD